MRNKTRKIISAFLTLAMMLGLFWAMAIPASAAEYAQSLADKINAFDHGGMGELTAVASGDTVTVTGKVIGVTKTLKILTRDETTVVWKAEYVGVTTTPLPSGDKPPLTFGGGRSVEPFPLIRLEGYGIFEVADGGSVISGGTGHAIIAPGRHAIIHVSGGKVSAVGNYNAINFEYTLPTLNISGGTIVAGEGNQGTGHAIYASNVGNIEINISGGEIKSEGAGGAIYCETGITLTISNATLSAQQETPTINVEQKSTINVEQNANIVQKGSADAIVVGGTNTVINVSGGLVSAEGGNAIETSGASTKINVSGGVLKSNKGDVIRSTGANTDIIITGGEISALGNSQLEYVIIGVGVRASGNSSKIYIDGGTISSARQFAVYHEGENAMININDGNVISINGGAALRTEKAEAAVYMSGGTIVAGFGHGIWTNGINSQIYLSGGVINVTGDGGRGIFTEGTHSQINMKGGLISAWGDSGNAICAFGTNTIIEISDGFVFNCAKAITGEYDVIRMLVGEPQIAGSSVVIAWNRSAGNTVYADGTSDDLVLAPAGASAFWTTGGIKYANGLNTGTFAIDGISIASNEPEPPPSRNLIEPPTKPEKESPTEPTPPSPPFPMTDVVSSDWFYNNVKTAWEMGLVNGKTPTTYEPTANLTYAEAVKLAACMHQYYKEGNVTLVIGTTNWYDTYVEYAKKNGIISKDYEWNTNATRAGYMEIFANALPDDALWAQNSVANGSIPDVPESHPQAAAIYKLYRAGIVQGVDNVTHACNPGSNIQRSEVAAIIDRMMNPTSRVTFTLG